MARFGRTMNSGRTPQELLEDIRSEDPQVKGAVLDVIIEDSISIEVAERLFPHVLDTLDCENAWVRMKAPEALVALAESHAASLGPKVDDHLSDLLELLNEGEKEVRAPVAQLVGAVGTEEAVRELDARLEYELDSVKTGIEAGLQIAIETAIDRLGTTDLDLNDPTSQSLIYLARTRPGWVVDHQQELFGLLDGQNSDIAGEVFATLLRTDARAEISTETLAEAIDIAQDADESQFARAVSALDAMARGRAVDETVAEVIDQYIDWLDADSPDVRRRGLDLLQPVAEHAPKHLMGRVDDIAVATTDSEPSIADAACELIKSYGTTISATPQKYLITLLSLTDRQPGFTWLADTLGVLQYKIDGRWQDIDMGMLGASLVDGLHRATVEGRTVPMFWPAFEPTVSVAAAIAVLFDGVPDRTDIVLYTKGTSTQWGGKGEVREEYQRYGIEIPEEIASDDGSSVIPLDELLPHGYVHDGQRRIKGDEAGPSTLVLVSNESQLDVVADTGPTLFNFHSRVTDDDEALVDEIIESDSNRLICPMYSLYSKHEHGGNRVPVYGPPELSGTGVLPDVRAVRDVLDTDPSGQKGGYSLPLDGDRDLRMLASARDIQVEAVDGSSIRENLAEGYDAAMFLVENGADHGGWRSFSYLQRFERLPVPVDRYDRWVLEKRRRSKRGQRSWTMEEFVEEFGDFVNEVDMLARAGTSDVHEQLKHLIRTLEQQNPLYEEICTQVEDALDEHRSLAIYTPTPSWRRTLRQCLLEDGVVYKSTLRSGRIQLVDRDSVREMDHCDELIIAGPQRQQQIGFHISPAADKITVLTYDGRWNGMIDRRLRRFVDKVNSTLQATDSEPIPYPTVSVEDDAIADDSILGDEETMIGDDEDGTRSYESESGRPDAEAMNLQERFAASLDETRFEDEYAYDKTRYDDYTQRVFDIETANGDVLHRESGSRVLVEEREVDGRDVETVYRWVTPAELSTDATVLTIEDDVWNQLWDEWLDEQYADIEGNRVTDQLRTWYDTITDIMAEIQQDLDADSPVADDVLDHIIRELRAVGVERGENRIEDWFVSVHTADDPLDLTRDPALTIAPGDVEDIQRIGDAFERDELTGDNGILLDQSLRKIRGAHVHEGREIRKDIATRLTEGGEDADYILDHVTRYEVTGIVDVTEVED